MDLQSLDILPQSEGRLTFEIHVPVGLRPGRYVVPIEMAYGDRRLGQFREAIIDVIDPAATG
jgi:hypothetical protein